MAKKITAEEFDAKFDAGEDMSEHLDLSKSFKRVNIDFPIWMLKEIDAESERLGVARQALLKMWIDQKLEGVRGRVKGQVG